MRVISNSSGSSSGRRIVDRRLSHHYVNNAVTHRLPHCKSPTLMCRIFFLFLRMITKKNCEYSVKKTACCVLTLYRLEIC